MNSPRSRTGYTLIELLIAMTIGTALMGTLAVLMARILSSNAAVKEHLQSVAALGRLGEQFRRDVHAATAAEVDGEVRRLRLDAPGRESIEYEICDAGLNRVVLRAGQAQAREQFVLAGMKVLGWNENSASTGELALELGRLARQDQDEPTVSSTFSITAALGRERRFRGGP
jgi:prepilin-type N-terminal cleavage/methylation domain-containing protein